MFTPVAVLIARHWSYHPLVTHTDYAQYLMHADALAHGRAYNDIGYIFTPLRALVGPSTLPPGLPLTLYPILRWFGPNPVLLKLLMAVCLTAFLLAVQKYFASRIGPWRAALVCMFLGLALETDYATNAVGSDLGFCALVWGVVLLAGEAEASWTWARAAEIAVLGSGAILYRLAGAPLIVGLGLFGLLHFKRLGVRPFVIVLVWCAVLYATYLVVESKPSESAALGPTVAARAARGVFGLLQGIWNHIYEYRLAVLDSHLYPFHWKFANSVYHVVSLSSLLFGLVLWVRQNRSSFLLCFLLAYLSMLLVVKVQDPRYLWPVYPLLTACLILGLEAILALVIPGQDRDVTRKVALTSLLVCGAFAFGEGLADKPPKNLLGEPDVQALFTWFRHVQGPETRVAFHNPRVFAWETGIPSMPVVRGSYDVVRAELTRNRITHFVAGDLGVHKFLDDSVRAFAQRFPGEFREEFRNSSFTVYRVLSSPAP